MVYKRMMHLYYDVHHPLVQSPFEIFGPYTKMMEGFYPIQYAVFQQSDRCRVGNPRTAAAGGLATEEED